MDQAGFAASHNRTSAAKLSAPVLRMTLARCDLTVFSTANEVGKRNANEMAAQTQTNWGQVYHSLIFELIEPLVVVLLGMLSLP